MEFLSVRELKNSSKEVWERLAKEEKMVITNNGKPTALMLDIRNSDLEATLRMLERMEALWALEKLRAEAEKRGWLTDEEINAEIQAARADIKARKCKRK